jgi:hypothetical protein
MAIVQASKSIRLSAGADDVWNFVSDFAGFASWQPHIESVEMQPNGHRTVLFTRGDSVVDQVTARDDDAKTFTYGLVPGQDTPLESLSATFTVRAVEGGSEVDYTIEVEVPDPMTEPARAGIGADIDGALAGLGKEFNG